MHPARFIKMFIFHYLKSAVKMETNQLQHPAVSSQVLSPPNPICISLSTESVDISKELAKFRISHKCIHQYNTPQTVD